MTDYITIRGVEHRVEVRDGGYEPDTNAHEIDWWFIDDDAPKDLTDEENEAVYLELCKRSVDRDFDADW